jgi:hypothetical protein
MFVVTGAVGFGDEATLVKIGDVPIHDLKQNDEISMLQVC